MNIITKLQQLETKIEDAFDFLDYNNWEYASKKVWGWIHDYDDLALKAEIELDTRRFIKKSNFYLQSMVDAGLDYESRVKHTSS